MAPLTGNRRGNENPAVEDWKEELEDAMQWAPTGKCSALLIRCQLLIREWVSKDGSANSSTRPSTYRECCLPTNARISMMANRQRASRATVVSERFRPLSPVEAPVGPSTGGSLPRQQRPETGSVQRRGRLGPGPFQKGGGQIQDVRGRLDPASALKLTRPVDDGGNVEGPFVEASLPPPQRLSPNRVWAA